MEEGCNAGTDYCFLEMMHGGVYYCVYWHCRPYKRYYLTGVRFFTIKYSSA